jgi:hypothetical protein
MCTHLKPLEDYLMVENMLEVYRGQVWTKNCREWIYYDAVLNPQKLKEKFHFDDTIIFIITKTQSRFRAWVSLHIMQ